MTLLTVELVKQISAIRERYKEIRRLPYRNERTEEGRGVMRRKKKIDQPSFASNRYRFDQNHI